MEKRGKQAFLYDFYGELLTEHQRQVYEEVVFHDLSLAEVAEDLGISRQGVHDLVRRCDKTLAGYEEKLHLVEHFLHARELIQRIADLADHYQDDVECTMAEIRQISVKILEDF